MQLISTSKCILSSLTTLLIQIFFKKNRKKQDIVPLIIKTNMLGQRKQTDINQEESYVTSMSDRRSKMKEKCPGLYLGGTASCDMTLVQRPKA